MTSTAQTILLFLVISFAYIWVSVPQLSYFSLQLSALLVIIYFVLKRVQKSKLWHIVPSAKTGEMAIVTLIFLLIIGSTGNTQSIFFAFSYLHLYFLVLALEVFPAILTTLGIIFFYYILTPTNNTHDIALLLSFPIVLTTFLLAKKQYEDKKNVEMELEEDKKEHADLETRTALFITTFLKPKLIALQNLAQYPEANKQTISQQIEIIKHKAEEVLEKNENQQTNIETPI